MKNRRNYYRILHVQPDAPAEIIRASYRTLMQRLHAHPDLGGDHWNATVINEAFDALKDVHRRSAYDLSRIRRQPAGEPAASERTTDAPARCPFCRTIHRFPDPVPDDTVCETCGSPLRPVGPAGSARLLRRGDRRRLVRLERRYPLQFRTGAAQAPRPGETADISLHGLRFTCGLRLTPGQCLRLDCPPLSAVARIVAVGPAGGAQRARGWAWLARAEFVTLRFHRTRAAFLTERA